MRNRVPLRVALCCILTIGVAVNGCSKNKVVTQNPEIDGMYTLISVDGKTMPADVSHDGVSIQVVSGEFTIDADGTCTSKTVFVPPTGAQIEREVSASYTLEGSTLTMQWQNAGMTVGTIEGDTFTMDNEGMVFVYRR